VEWPKGYEEIAVLQSFAVISTDFCCYRLTRLPSFEASSLRHQPEQVDSWIGQRAETRRGPSITMQGCQ
jgi:hypothetical protein